MMFLRRILLAAMLVTLALSLTACSKGVEGSWKLTGGNAIGAIYSLDPAGSLESSAAEVIFTFNDDGVLTIYMTRSGITTKATGTWEESGDQLALILDGSTLKCSYSIDNDELTIFFTYQDQNANFILKRT